MKLTIAIVAGGYSAEDEISFQSAKTVFDNLDRSRYEPIIVEIKQDGWHAVLGEEKYEINKNDFSFRFDENTIRFDYVFIAIHGTPGEDGKLQAYFDLLKIPYSSPDHVGSTLTFNKWYCSTLLSQLGYNLSQNVYLREFDKVDENKIVDHLGLPCFVKPCSAGSSYGITKVKKIEQLSSAISKAFEYDHEIMIESMMTGIEVTCGVYQNNGKVEALPITQIIPKGEFFDYAAKYQGDSMEITPARIDEKSYKLVQNVSKEIYQKLNLRGVIRVDFILIDQVPHIIEVNAVPGLSKESLIPQQVEAAKISLPNFFTSIIEETIKN